MRKWLLMMVAGFLWKKYAGRRTYSPPRRPRVTPQI
jgi:hypothetical protein